MDKKSMMNFKNIFSSMKKKKTVIIALSCIIVGLLALFFGIQFSNALPSGNKVPKGWKNLGNYLSVKNDSSFARLNQNVPYKSYTSFNGGWTAEERIDTDSTCKTRKIRLKKGGTLFGDFQNSKTASGYSFVVPKGIKYLGNYYDLRIAVYHIESEVGYKKKNDINHRNELAVSCRNNSFPSFVLESQKDKHVEIEFEVAIVNKGVPVKIPDLVIGIDDVDAYQSYGLPDKITKSTAFAPQSAINFFKTTKTAAYLNVNNYKQIKSIASAKISDTTTVGKLYVNSPTASTGKYHITFGFDHRAHSGIEVYIHKYDVTYKAGTGAKISGTKTESKVSGDKPSAGTSVVNPSPASGYGGSPIYNCTMGGKKVVTNGTVANVRAVKLTNDMTCTVSYNPLYKVTYAVDGEGGTIKGIKNENVLKNNKPVGTTETANTGYIMDGWTCMQGTKAVLGPKATMVQIRALSITANTDCKVKYSKKPEKSVYTVTYASADSGGTVTGDTNEQVDAGSKPKADVVDTANTKYKTTNKWTCKGKNGAVVADLSEVTLSRIKLTEVNQDMDCTVPHTPLPPDPEKYTVTYAVEGEGGKITGKTSETVTSGDNPSGTTENANNHYTLKGWRCTAGSDTVLAAGSTMESLKALVITANTNCFVSYNPAPKYTVTYASADSNGTVSGTTSESVYKGEKPNANVTDNADYGYVTTNKWTCKTTSGNVISELSEVTLSKIKTYSVTENMDCTVPHATDPIPVKYTTDENGKIKEGSLKDETIRRGTKATGSIDVPNQGYRFKGWINSVAVKINDETIPAGSLLTDAQVKNSIITAATTFKAINVPIDYTITYETDSGGIITNPNTNDGKRIDTRAYGVKVESGANLKTKPGYKLNGWSCKDDSGVAVSTLQNVTMEAIENWTVTSNLTCKATHTTNKYSITYQTDGNGSVPKALDDTGNPVDNNSEILDFGSNPNGAVETPNRGYTTTHWTCNKNITLKDGSKIDANSNINMVDIKNIVMDDNITCTVYHGKNSYVVTYNNTDGHGVVTNVNGGGDGSSTESVDYGSNPSGAQYSPNSGYKYEKWTVNKNVTLTDGTTVTSGNPISEKDIKKVVVNENLTFTVWFEKIISVTLNKYEMLENGLKTETKLEGGEFELYEGSSAGKCLGGPYTSSNACTSHGVCKYTKEIDGEDCEVTLQKETAEGCEMEVEADYGRNMVYTPYKWENSSSRLIGTYTTDSNGQINVNQIINKNGSITNFEKGTEYYFLEKKAPKSHVITEEVTSFIANDDDIELKVYNKRKPGSVKLIKTDKKGNRLDGALFGLYKRGASETNSLEYYTSNAVSFDYTSAGIVINGDKVFGKSSLGLINESFTQSKMDEALSKATFAEAKEIITPYLNGEYGSNLKGYVIEDYSSELYAVLLVDSITGNSSNGSGIGKMYLIKTTMPDPNAFGKVGTYTTNVNGEIIIDNLTWTDYYLKEIIPPLGYQLNDERYEFTIDNETAENVIEITAIDNEAEGKVLFTKKDENDNQLSGAKFNLYKNDGTLVRTNLETNSSGQILVEGLPFGIYYFDEIEAPTGYGLSDEKAVFEINKNNVSKQVEVSMKDSKDSKPYVKVTKKIKKSDIIYEHGEASFIFRLSGKDESNNNHEYYKTLTFKQSVVDNQNSEYVSLTTIFKGLEVGTYTLSEETVNRYIINQITDISATGAQESNTVKFTLNGVTSNGEATFVNKKIKQSGLTHTDIVTNVFRKK